MNDASQHPDTQTSALAREVVDLACASLFVDMRFLDTAVFRLRFVPTEMGEGRSWSTNGRDCLYDPQRLLRRYSDCRTAPVHDILHAVLHCVFRHMFVFAGVERRLWDLACDIAVESLIASLESPGVRDGREVLRDDVIEKAVAALGTVTAEKTYAWLMEQGLPEAEIARLEDVFGVDSHNWYDIAPEADDEPQHEGHVTGGGDDAASVARRAGEVLSASECEALAQAWEDVARNIQTGLETMFGSKTRSAETGGLLQALKAVNRRHYDYKSFLRSFATLGEVMQVNPDEFDLVYYTYGLETYGDTPLIEPLEHKEVKGLRDIAIVLDTSGSVSGELVQHLFERTFDLIMDEENAFKQFRIHLIQCDAEVRRDTVLTCREDLEALLEDFAFEGGGGTDFVAAFDYVDTLVAQGAFHDFRGLIYFTDGRGRYPKRMPAYRAAFVFLDDEYDDHQVPAWAIKLVLTSDEVRVL